MTRALKTAPWQLWVVDFGVPAEHGQGGVRPAIVVGSAQVAAGDGGGLTR
jgi:mRNA interferase MazF